MKRFTRAIFAALLVCATFAVSRPAHAVVVERIIAIVGERPIPGTGVE